MTTYTMALERYDRHVPFFTGAITPPAGIEIEPLEVGIDLTHRDGRDRHERMLRRNEFDICELSFSSYIMAVDRGADLTATPVFPRRLFSQNHIYVRADSGIQKVDDLKTKQVIMGSTGKGSQTFLMPSLVNGVLGAKFKIVSGYKGSRKAQLAMEQNEVQGVALTWLSWKSAKEKWFTDGFAMPVVQIGVTKEQDLPNVPMLADLVTGENKQIVNFMATMGPLGRGLTVPKGTPQDRVDFLRAAFAKTVADPNFVVNAEKRKLRVKAATGLELQKIVNDSLKVSDETVKRARALIFGKSS